MHKSNERCVWTTCFETVFFFAVLTVFCFGGCDTNIDSSQDPDWQANNSEADIASDDGKSQSKDPKEDELLEGYERTGEASVSWRVTCMGDSKVGFSQVTEQELKSPTGERFILVELKDKTRVKRFKQKTNQSYSCRSLLDGEGKLIGFVSELDAGSGLLTTRGRVKGDRLRLETANRAETQIDSVAWQASYRGHGADELSLRETPLKPGETRTIEMLAPLVHQVMKVTWKAKDYADVVLPDGKTMKLLEIEETSALPAISIEGTRWVDEKGLVWMVSLPTLAQTTYRTTEANALAVRSTWESRRLLRPSFRLASRTIRTGRSESSIRRNSSVRTQPSRSCKAPRNRSGRSMIGRLRSTLSPFAPTSRWRSR